MNRRQFIKGIGAALCAGVTAPTFIPALLDTEANIAAHTVDDNSPLSFSEYLKLVYGDSVQDNLQENSTIWENVEKYSIGKGGSLVVPFNHAT